MRRRDFVLAALVASTWRFGQSANAAGGSQQLLVDADSGWLISHSLARHNATLPALACAPTMLPADTSAAMAVLARLHEAHEFRALLDDRDLVLLSFVLGHPGYFHESILAFANGERANVVIAGN